MSCAARAIEFLSALRSYSFRAVAFCGIFAVIGLLKIRAQEETGAPKTEWQAGWIAEYRSISADGAQGERIYRIDSKPAFAVLEGSVEPAIPPGAFEARWRGWLEIRDTELPDLKVHAFVCGDLEWRIDGKVVLRGSGSAPNSELHSDQLEGIGAGWRLVEIFYRSRASGPARLKLSWSGRGFAREPLPAWRMRHRTNERSPEIERDLEWGRERARLSQLGCARCHEGSMPSIDPTPPGPSLVDAGKRFSKEALMRWILAPSEMRHETAMPRMVSHDAAGRVEAEWIALYLMSAGNSTGAERETALPDHRPGRTLFLGLGCLACHGAPDDGGGSDAPKKVENDGRSSLRGLAGRFGLESLADFLESPNLRYRDGRMPKVPMSRAEARSLAAYLLHFSGGSIDGDRGGVALKETPLTSEEDRRDVMARLGAQDAREAGRKLFGERHCTACHEGPEGLARRSYPIRTLEAGCLSVGPSVVAGGVRAPVYAWRTGEGGVGIDRPAAGAVRRAAEELPVSGHVQRLRDLDRAGCIRCHARDGDGEGGSMLERAASGEWTAHLARLPFQRTPALTQALDKYERGALEEAVRDGVRGLRPSWYSYRMPAYGDRAPGLIRALAESDGEWYEEKTSGDRRPSGDPGLLESGRTLIGFEGYGCVSCHLWKGRGLVEADPASIGPDLTRVAGRIRREWFERWMRDPQRIHSGTVMPSFFSAELKGTGLPGGVEGDEKRGVEALWQFLSQGKTASDPGPRPVDWVRWPEGVGGPLIAQIPVELEDEGWIESIVMWDASGALFVYDLERGDLVREYARAGLVRNPNGNRSFQIRGQLVWRASTTHRGGLSWRGPEGEERPKRVEWVRVDRRTDGMEVASRFEFAAGKVDVIQRLVLRKVDGRRTAEWGWRLGETSVGVAGGGGVVRKPMGDAVKGIQSLDGREVGGDGAQSVGAGGIEVNRAAAANERGWRWELGAASDGELPTIEVHRTWEAELKEAGELRRPGFRAIRIPLSRTKRGEDAVMPAALAVDPRTDRLFVASLKFGEVFTLDERERKGGGGLEFGLRDYTGGVFQDALALEHDGTALRVAHRRNVTRIVDRDGDGIGDRYERVASIPHGKANAYDWAYGLVRDGAGRLLVSLAPHANQKTKGSGSALWLDPAKGWDGSEEVAWGFRNPTGWTMGPGGAVFFSDNQGEWVATSKIGHLVAGSFNGYPNPMQPEHRSKPMAPAAVWVPYEWARSVNGIVWENSRSGFGPFTGQLFMAELMNGGGIYRANLEQVKGVYQGACFPFWGPGLVGPLSVAFDSRGRLYVGSLTMPGWMGQPDRGALFRIERTGEEFFDLEAIRIWNRGFRVRFTAEFDPASVGAPHQWEVRSHRYEYTGAYGSPELDRREIAVREVRMAEWGRSVELDLAGVERGRVYSVMAREARSRSGVEVLNRRGVYTVNEVPDP